MKYLVLHDGREQEVDVRDAGDRRYEITAFGRTFTVSAEQLPGGQLLLHRDNGVFELSFDGSVVVRGRRVELEVLNAREAQQHRLHATEQRSGAWQVRAPMPGKIVALLAKPGDQVSQGQGLVVIEAMKMENELRAPKAGTIAQVHAAVGATVEAKTVLVSSTD